MEPLGLVTMVVLDIVTSPSPSVCHGCGESGHIRPNCPNQVKHVSSTTLGHFSSKQEYFVKGYVNDTPCDKLFISECEIMCVAKRLVPDWQNHIITRVQGFIKA